MPADPEHDHPQSYSRRSILGKLTLGLATIAGAGFLVRSFLFSSGKEQPQHVSNFPGEDSIFHPRRDPRLEAVERRRKG